MNRRFQAIFRWTFRGCVLFSTLLSLITLVLWIHSYLAEYVSSSRYVQATGVVKNSIKSASHDIDLASCRGQFSVQIWPTPQRWAEHPESRSDPQTIVWLGVAIPWHEVNLFGRGFPWRGFDFVHAWSFGGRWYWTISGCYSYIAMITGILPAIWSWRLIVRIRAARRRKIGYCGKCGYDLRASTDRCPECGTPVPILLTSTPASTPHPTLPPDRIG
jgi:hypothetical protein